MVYSSEFEISDRAYGKESIKVMEVEKDGDFHTLKEYIINMKTTLDDVKEYWTHDNSNLVCATAFQQILYILAKNHGLKSPESFGILGCNRLLAQYNQIKRISLYIEEAPWKRVSHDGEKFHNHAFTIQPECIRTCTVTVERSDMKPIVESGVKDLQMVKTTKANFVGVYRDEFRTAPDLLDRVLCAKYTFSWDYKDYIENLDYDKIWKTARDAVLKNWTGHIIEGAFKSSTQFASQEALRSVLEAIPEAKSINSDHYNLIYYDVDFSPFPEHLVEKNENRQILMPSLPSAYGFLKIERKEN